MTNALNDFLKHEAAGGVLLMVTALVAIVAVNAGFADLYSAIWATPFTLGFGEWALTKPVLLWINDGLMAVFFLLVGLELKRELMIGELASPRRAALPLIAALGGIVVPGALYLMAVPEGAAQRGWAVPVATDIAFALGILLLLGSRVPLALKAFLTGVVIVDDLVAILIIAIFYSGSLNTIAMGIALGLFIGLLVAGHIGVRSIPLYCIIGFILWVAVLKSGLHATLAGVMLAITVPLDAGTERQDRSPLIRLEHFLHPWVAFGVLPIFAFANAGVVFSAPPGGVAGAVTVGVILGLVVGKPIGILGLSLVAVRTGVAELPNGTSWGQILGVSMLCGVGFTMSLFIGSLAFDEVSLMDASKVGIIVGSTISAILGVGAIWWATRGGNRDTGDSATSQ